MSRRVLVAGGAPEARHAMAAAIDAGFDVDIEQPADVLGVLRLLPNRGHDLFIVLAGDAGTPALDLVRFLSAHALHADVPVVLVGGSDDERRMANACGVRYLLRADAGADEVRRIVRDALGLG